jgi:hypothetical protein
LTISVREMNAAGAFHLMRKDSLVSLVPFISSRIQRGAAPRPDQTSFGFFLLRNCGATFLTFLPVRAGFRPRAFVPVNLAAFEARPCDLRSLLPLRREAYANAAG